MRPARLVLAAVLLLGYAGGAEGTPLIPSLAGVALQPHSDIEAARWQRWSCFLRQAVKVDSAMKRVIHHEDAETVFG